MAKVLAPPPKFTLYIEGVPAVGALIYTYLANSSTPAVTYYDNEGNENENPVELDARGEADIRLTPGIFYKFVAKTPLGATIWTVDYISNSSGSSEIFEDLTVTGSSNLLPYLAFQIIADDVVAEVDQYKRFPVFPCEILDFKLFCDEQSSSGDVEVDVLYCPDNVDGDSIFTTLPTIAANADYSVDGTLDPTKTTVSDWTKFKAVITEDGTGATGVTIILYVRPAT